MSSLASAAPGAKANIDQADVLGVERVTSEDRGGAPTNRLKDGAIYPDKSAPYAS